MRAIPNTSALITILVVMLVSASGLAQSHAIGMDDSSAIGNLIDQQQKQARAIVTQVGKDQKSQKTEIQIPENALERETQRQNTINNRVAAQISEVQINKVRASFPQLGFIGDRIKYGQHHVVSKHGEAIINLIRSLIQAQATQRQSTLRKIQAFAEKGAPEALHFFGFAFEYGIFGANKDLPKAIQYYQRAAQSRYQPSLYNLALISAYGHLGQRDLEKSRQLINQAYALGNESSYRVCGFASFISYRLNKHSEAWQYAHQCASPLANFAQALYNDQSSLEKRVSLLRNSLATGVDDGYRLIIQIAKPVMATDNNHTFCKYILVDRYRHRTAFSHLQEDAARCVNQTSLSRVDLKNKFLYEQIVRGIAGFVPVEINTLKNIRKSNHFHHNWSVPYLPFGLQETSLLAPLIKP